MFNFDFKNIVKLLLPIAMRKEKVIMWLTALIQPLISLKDTFIAYRDEKLFLLAHNSQVIYLEHILNSRFGRGPDGHEIYITDGESSDEIWLYNDEESLGNTYLYNNSETGFVQVYDYNNSEFAELTGFVINIPASWTINQNELKALVQKLKLAGKIFKIKKYIFS